MRLLVATVLVTLTAAAGVATAYPQYQLSKEQNCVACHLSPVGGGLLNDYGELVAEEESQWGGNPAFLHGALELPDILSIGGDLRAAGGVHTRGDGLGGAAFPMQTELYVAAEKNGFGAYVVGGLTIEGEGVKPFSREHYLVYKQGEGEGLYVRLGRFMPVQGLRMPEHVFYTRRYGGTPLFTEVYGANVGYLSPGLEAHATAFVHDPLIDGIEDGDGAAVYVEKRLGTRASVGLLDRYTTSDVDTRLHTGLTGKVWLPDTKLLLSAEAQVIRQNFKLARGPIRYQLVGQLLATYFVRPGLFVDLGLGHHDEDLSIKNLDRDAVDLNIHFFPLSHLETILTMRLQTLGLTSGGATSGFTLLQLHYRI